MSATQLTSAVQDSLGSQERGPEMAAVLRSMEAHIGSRRTALIDVADFLSAWRCAAGRVRPWKCL